jgi:hypothetical protein
VESETVLPADGIEIVIPMLKVTCIGVLVTLLLFVGATLAYILFWGSGSMAIGSASLPRFLIIGLILHEGLHAAGWILAARVGVRDIRFGIFWRYLAPYAHCKVPMPMAAYRFAVLLPGVLTGVIPLFVGLGTQNFDLTLAGAVLTGGAAGDVAVLWASRPYDRAQRVMDHPSKPGFLLVE